MSTKNPRPNRAEVHTSIIQTAREIAAKEGWSAVTVRKVAQSIGYTAPIIYEHFGSKDEMLDQILKHGYDVLFAKMQDSLKDVTDSEARVKTIAKAYWDFAHETPELYFLMYGMCGAKATTDRARDYAIPMVKLITEEMIRYNPERINATNVAVVMVQAWSFVHGMISLEVLGYTQRYVTDANLQEVLSENVLDVLRRQ
jgi:AcrR family transcriptional regulator